MSAKVSTAGLYLARRVSRVLRSAGRHHALAPGEYRGERSVLDRAEQEMAGQSGPAQSGGGHAAQESGHLAGTAQGEGVSVAHCAQRGDVEPFRQSRPGWSLRQRLTPPREAVGAMSARRRARLAEIADQGVDLTTIVRDQRQDPAKSRQLLSLARFEAAPELADQRLGILAWPQPAIALAHLGGAELRPALFCQIFEGTNDAIAALSQRLGDRAGVERVPNTTLLGGRKDGSDEVGP